MISSAIHRVVRASIAAMVMVAGASVAAVAQSGPPGGPPGPPEQGRPGGARINDSSRAQIERRLQDRINQVVRQRLALTDEQFARLRDVASKIEDDRRALRTDEAITRFSMRQELLAGDRVNEARVTDLLAKMPQMERRRLELMENEQRELAKFLSPSQRARYLGLQDELRRSMQELQRRRQDASDDSVPPFRPGAARRPKRLPPGDL